MREPSKTIGLLKESKAILSVHSLLVLSNEVMATEKLTSLKLEIFVKY